MTEIKDTKTAYVSWLKSTLNVFGISRRHLAVNTAVGTALEAFLDTHRADMHVGKAFGLMWRAIIPHRYVLCPHTCISDPQTLQETTAEQKVEACRAAVCSKYNPHNFDKNHTNLLSVSIHINMALFKFKTITLEKNNNAQRYKST